MELTPDTEKELLHEVAAGSERAFAALFNAYRKKLYTNIYRLTESRQTAEDTVHEVFLKVWLNRASLTNVDNFGAYLQRMARNQAISGFRRMAKETLIISELKKEEAGQALTTQPPQPEHQLMTKEVKAFIRQAVDKLTPQQKSVYLLSRDGGLKTDEIARQLGISQNTAKKHLSAALHHLRRAISDTYGPYAVALYVLFDICHP
ncbi:RNA polymerase sigma factor [Chitinophaga sp. NPDC101104]|uniref:RNA polymerase sigma factor n=1 Tax=Chitinophaga sp. NPDC101104 TaxID=3390561 RepID=UPI003CFDBB6D